MLVWAAYLLWYLSVCVYVDVRLWIRSPAGLWSGSSLIKQQRVQTFLTSDLFNPWNAHINSRCKLLQICCKWPLRTYITPVRLLGVNPDNSCIKCNEETMFHCKKRLLMWFANRLKSFSLEAKLCSLHIYPVNLVVHVSL